MKVRMQLRHIAGFGPAERKGEVVIVPVMLTTGDHVALVATPEVWAQLRISTYDASLPPLGRPRQEDERAVITKPGGRIL